MDTWNTLIVSNQAALAFAAEALRADVVYPIAEVPA